ncbi:MAG: DUF4200 domain-containing protein [Microscillaceae bacterium]|nr:DUF4200 domain-containing protein [Microscillaceae bacterium]
MVIQAPNTQTVFSQFRTVETTAARSIQIGRFNATTDLFTHSMHLGIGSATSATSNIPYWTNNDPLGKLMLGTDGLPTMLIDGMNNGRVGIGTITPMTKLDVIANDAVSAASAKFRVASFYHNDFTANNSPSSFIRIGAKNSTRDSWLDIGVSTLFGAKINSNTGGLLIDSTSVRIGDSGMLYGEGSNDYPLKVATSGSNYSFVAHGGGGYGAWIRVLTQSSSTKAFRVSKFAYNRTGYDDSELFSVNTDGRITMASNYYSPNNYGNFRLFVQDGITTDRVNIGTVTTPPTDISNFRLNVNGGVLLDKVYIGAYTTLPYESTFRLHVKDGIRTERVKVDVAASNGWPDYVFAPDYKLRPLAEVEKFIKANQHLPEVPSAKELEKNGMDLTEMHKIQMQKIEELTLYLIELKKENEVLKKKVEQLEQKIK